MNRISAVMAGGVGLILGLFLTLFALLLRPVIVPTLPPALTWPMIAWAMFLLFMILALLEIPVMIYGLRKIGEGSSPHTPTVTQIGTGIFVFFSAVYALPNLLVSSYQFTWMGLIISGTGFLRFAASSLFLPTQSSNMDDSQL